MSWACIDRILLSVASCLILLWACADFVFSVLESVFYDNGFVLSLLINMKRYVGGRVLPNLLSHNAFVSLSFIYHGQDFMLPDHGRPCLTMVRMHARPWSRFMVDYCQQTCLTMVEYTWSRKVSNHGRLWSSVYNISPLLGRLGNHSPRNQRKINYCIIVGNMSDHVRPNCNKVVVKL